jgi:hypothetical protein
MKLTGAAISVSRGIEVLQAAPAAYPYRSAARFSMYNVRRLADALAPHGFFVAVEAEMEAWFLRANIQQKLFEGIEVNAGKHRGGRWGDIAFSDVSISLTPGRFTSPKGMAEVELLTDWSPTKTKEQALAWERTIVDSWPQMLGELVRARGDELLARTAETRAAVEKYLELVDSRLPVAESIAKLSDGASEAELAEARRLSRTEGFICLPERPWYDLISLLFARKAGEVERDPTKFWGKNPIAMPELNWRFQLLASRLYPERGWELLGA